MTTSPFSTTTVPAVGPAYRSGFNPLTGRPVSSLQTLLKVPLLISITEFPPSARPQSGLSAASQVWETSIGEGMSRFLAVYYGDYQEVLSDLLESHPELTASDPAIGPIRQIRWEYDPDRGTYLRSQDQADGRGVLVPSFDRLSGDRLQADNVLVLFAEHKYQNLQGTILSIELAYVPKRFGLLFRDGRQYEIQWSSPGLEFRVQDDRGRPVPLKPGVTFFEVVSFESSWDPVARIVRFHNPPLPTLTMTLTPTPTATITPSATESAVPPTGTATP